MKKGWLTKRLGDLCDVVGGGTPSKDNPAFYSGKIPWATVRDMRQEVITETECRITKDAVQRSATNIIPTGNVVIATRVGLGKVCLLGQDTAINRDLRGIIPRDSKTLLVRFLFWWLKSISDVIITEGTGATVQGVKLPFVKALQIPVPPLPEQQRIVGILDEAFAGIATARANTEKNLQNARALFESHLNSVFTQRGKGWVTRPLADCLQLITYGFTNPMPTTTEGPYMVTAKNVVGGRIDYQSTRRTSREAFDTLLTDKSRPHLGDVLLTKDGTLGRVAVVDQPNICINQSVALLRPNGRMTPQFMRCLLSSSEYQQRMVDDAGGTTIKHIYITRVDKMPVRFPESLKEQQTVVVSLDVLDGETQRFASLYERKLAALEALKKSLLQQAFTGNL